MTASPAHALARAMLLAFDTSGPVGSVAVSHGPDVLARAVMTPQAGHASSLVPTIDEVLEDAGVARDELTGLLVGSGPGSFTGVRVAAATAKGLRRALGIPLWGVSSLAAAAMSASVGPIRYVLFDARADRVYGACFGVGSVGVETVVAPHAGHLRDVLASDVPGGAVFTGDGSEKHRAAIEAAGFEVGSAELELSLADGLVAYLAAEPDTRPLADPAGWEPEYGRASSAERLWPT